MENNSHPWKNFLDARLEAITWLHQQGNNDKEIARTLSMDETQVRLIRTHPMNNSVQCKKCDEISPLFD